MIELNNFVEDLKQLQGKAGLTQEEIAFKLKTNKGNISWIENHSEDIWLSTLEKYAKAIEKKSVSILYSIIH